MKLLTQNSKIKKSGVRTFNFGIPAYQSSTGLKTCPQAGACAKGCYALAGAYRFSNVAKAFEARLEATLQPDFDARMVEEIRACKAKRVRIHDSGDFYNYGYLAKWLSVMKQLPDVQFYAYTKQVAMFQDAQDEGLLPANFTVVFSYGGLQDAMIDRKRDRHSRVFESMEALKAAGYVDTNETDDAAANPAIRCIGLVYHGTKSLSNTNWSAVETKIQREVKHVSKIRKLLSFAKAWAWPSSRR